MEVITNPGARYNANVKSVIRITTLKPAGEGFSFETKTSSMINEQKRMSWIENLRLNFRHGKWDANAQVYGAWTHRQDDKRIQQFTYLNDIWKQISDISQEFTNINPYVRLATSCTLDEHNSLGASVSYDHYAKNLGIADLRGMTMRDDVQTEFSASHVEFPATSKIVSSNVYYTWNTGKLDIDFNTDYYWSGKDETMNNTDWYTTAEQANQKQNVKSERTIYNSLLASKLVLSVPLAAGKLSLGGEFSISRRKNSYNVLPKDIVDDENSRIKETLSAIFVDYSGSFGKLRAQAGLRYEYINFNYYDYGVYIPGQSRTYGNLFPSITFSLPVGKSQMQLTYATDIQRPYYDQLRDGVQYDNHYTYESGNPFLKPSFSRNLSYAFSWRWMNMSCIFSHISDEINFLTQTYKDNPQITLARPENLPAYNNMQVALALNPELGIWYPALEMRLYKQWYHMETHEGGRLDRPVGTLRLTNTVDCRWLTVSVVMSVQTKGNKGNSYERRGYFNTDMYLNKTLLNKRLMLELSVKDLFRTANRYHVIYSGTQKSMYYDSYSSSSVNFTVRYRFNVTSSKYKGIGAGQAQKGRM